MDRTQGGMGTGLIGDMYYSLAANVLLDTNDRMNDCRKGTILANWRTILLPHAILYKENKNTLCDWYIIGWLLFANTYWAYPARK